MQTTIMLQQLRSEAFYLAHSETPDAPMVKQTLQQGLLGCRIIDHRCPFAVLQPGPWVVQLVQTQNTVHLKMNQDMGA